MMQRHKQTIDGFIEGMSSFDLIPSCDFEIEPYSLSVPFQKVADSFVKVGNIMYCILENEGHQHETKRHV